MKMSQNMAHTHLITMIVRHRYVSFTGSAFNSFNGMQRNIWFIVKCLI